MGRRAYTLIEVLVAMVVASTLLPMALSFFAAGQRQTASLSFRLKGLQSAYLLRTWVADDLASHCPSAPGRRPFTVSPMLTFTRTISNDGRGVYDTCLNDRYRALTERVTYRFYPDRGVVERSVDGVGRPLLGARFRDVRFDYHPGGTEGFHGETVVMHVTIVADDVVGDDTTTSHSFTFHCPQTTLHRVYGEWAY